MLGQSGASPQTPLGSRGSGVAPRPRPSPGPDPAPGRVAGGAIPSPLPPGGSLWDADVHAPRPQEQL